MSKLEYSVNRVSKNQCFDILNGWHYLSNESKGLEGEWRPRSVKHRFLITFDAKLTTRRVQL